VILVNTQNFVELKEKKKHGGPLLPSTCYWASYSHEIPQATGSVLLVNTHNSALEIDAPHLPKRKKKRKKLTNEFLPLKKK